tara:strand:+ start:8699 stop:9448 length:750 start_codon:yes stop_codon:yes gene_type:complete
MRAKPVGELLFARLYLRYLSLPFTQILLRTSATPNQVTVAFLLCGFAGGLMQLDQQHRFVAIAGSLVLQFALILDCVDGEIARVKKQYSIKGPYLDMVGHRLIHCVLFFSLGVGLYQRSQDPRWLMLACGAVFGESAFTMMLYAKWRVLLDYPDVIRNEIDKITNTAPEDQKRLKAGLSAKARPNPLLWPYHAVFSIDYPGMLLASLVVLSAIDQAHFILYVYGSVLPARALLFFGRKMFTEYHPEIMP